MNTNITFKDPAMAKLKKEHSTISLNEINNYHTVTFKPYYENKQFLVKTEEALERVEKRGIRRQSADDFLKELDKW